MSDDIKREYPDLGLDADAVEGITHIFKTLLADEYVLYTKLRHFHWNVTGPQFRSLHQLFEEQYTALETTIDQTAERLRSYGPYAPGTMAQFLEMTRLQEQGGVPTAQEMVQELAADHEHMVRLLRDDIDNADDYDDDGAEDFLTGLLQAHQEQAWMLRTFLQGAAF